MTTNGDTLFPSPLPPEEEVHCHDDVEDGPSHLLTPIENRQSCISLLRSALRNPDQLTAMISNYSTSYNAINVGIVLPMLDYSISSKGSGGDLSPYTAIGRHLNDNTNSNNNKEEDEEDSIVASSLLAGMIFGQLIGGFLGDKIGRRNAMLLVMILQIAGSLGSALFVSTGDEATEPAKVYEQLAIWRFILGIGAGGVYPLAAVMSAENKQESDPEEEDITPVNRDGEVPQINGTSEREWNDEEDVHTETADQQSNATISSFQRIALTFSTQGLGFITVPLLAYPMLELRWNIDLIWRLLLGLGALPGVWVLYLRLCSRNTRVFKYNATKKTDDVPETDAVNSSGHLNTSDESSINKASLELPTSSNERTGDGGNTDAQAAVSTLFGDISDIMRTDSNDAIAMGHSEDHVMALVDNSHVESDKNDDEEDECNDAPLTPLRDHPRGLWESIQTEPQLGRKLAGTAGTWFLFDMLFYGNTLFEPLVLEAAFGHNSSTDAYALLQTAVRDSLVISLLSLPGYFVTVLLIGRRTCACRSTRSSSTTTRCGSASCFPCNQTPTYIQMQGFLLMFILYIVIGVGWKSLENIQWLLLLLYAGTFFFSNYGPNTTTFLLPSVTYSEECRSTLNGICAAFGKIGALLGASIFAPLSDTFGESVVMVSCGCVSLVAWALTKVCLGRRT